MIDSFADALVVAAGGGAFAGAVWIGRRVLQLIREGRETLQDWRGTPARPGVERRPGVLELIAQLRDRVAHLDETLGAHLGQVGEEREALKMARAVEDARRAGHEEAAQLWSLMESVADGRVPSDLEEEESNGS